ncbi:murein transglycosylase [Vibrio sp. TRT 21S02]|uniref:murein transglycosylase n=1 Tax=Vibrio sp. TRT 21S02 TaxID=3418507 RepID=UPI003CF298C6
MMPSFSLLSQRLPSSLLTFAVMMSGSTYSHWVQASDIQHQRATYDKAQQLLDQKKVSEYRKIRPEIASYPLTPYVDYRAFLVDLGSKTPKQVNRFISEHKTFPFSARISAPYLNKLAAQKQWKTLLDFQHDEPKGERYQCLYYRAQYHAGSKELAFKGAEDLWLSGKSVSSSCDPLFKAWNNAGHQTEKLVMERMLLAFEARNGSLMNYLKKQLKSQSYLDKATTMKSLYSKPESVVAFAKKHLVTPFNQKQAVIAMKKLARTDVEKAQQALNQVAKTQKLDEKERQSLADYISFRLINTDSASLAKWRDQAISTSKNTALIERRARLAIQQQDWKGLQKWIATLPLDKQQSMRWQYWLGRSEIALGKANQGKKRLEKQVGQLNFYSVAAAKEIQQSINYSFASLTYKPEMVKPFSKTLARIDELIKVNKIAAAKSEWRWLLRNVTEEQSEMLAAYAASKRWHHLTVTASIQAKMWDNIEMRFPVAHRWWFNFYGDKHDIDPITLMSLARQESALDVEARSPVGARGIMQIMPSTAKYTARKYKLSYQGSNDLYEVGKNIEIGSQYLKSLLEKYDNNRIFALAAYNAGPHRVKTWRERTQGKLDAYAFIEAIPFNETRGYVQNILMFETYYREILGVDGAFLNQNEASAKY